jgi:pilus assembly protein CpaC
MTTHSIRHLKKISLSICIAIAFPVTPAQPTNSAALASPMAGLAVDKTQPKAIAPNVIQGTVAAPIPKVKSDESTVPEIEMFVGESRVFPTPGVGRIAVGNGNILTASALDKKEVILFANAVGTSSLYVWSDDGRYQRLKVVISQGDTARYAREISTFLSSISGAKTSIIGDKVIVEGDNLADSDIAKIDELAKRYPQIVNFTNRLGWEKMILMDVKVVEFPVNELREIGIKWNATGGAAFGGVWAPVTRKSPSEYSIGVTGGPVGPAVSGASLVYPTQLKSISAVNAGADGKLNLLAQSGNASVLAEPQLSARNGSKASFLAGGEYPYSVSTINGPTVIFKPYGIKLDITPRVDRNGVVRAVIESEVSSIDTSLNTIAGPALSTRKTSTEFNVQAGETLVLSGLISRKNSNSIDKMPGLGDIPILGALFRSKRFQNDETELVVFVTPTIVDSQTPGLVDRVQRAQERLQNNLGPAPHLTDPLQPNHDPANTPVIQEALPPPKDEEQ